MIVVVTYLLGAVLTYGITTLSTNDPKPSLKLFEMLFILLAVAKR